MRLISLRNLRTDTAKYPDVKKQIDEWSALVRQAKWKNLEDVRRIYRNAEAVSNFTVFNMKGNNYQLIVGINYEEQIVYYKYFLTQISPQVIETEEEYDRILAIVERLIFTQIRIPEERALLKLLVQLIESYESEHYPNSQIRDYPNSQIRYYPTAIIDPAIRKLHPELQEAAYLITEKPVDKVVVLVPGDSVVLVEYQLSIRLIETGGEDSKGQQYADLELMFSDGKSYNGTRYNPGDTGFVPNPNNYPTLAQQNLLHCAQRVYRTHRLCTGEIKSLQIIELAGGYRNYLGRSRFYEQCLLDGSFDTYYEEHCDFGIVRLMEGIVYNLPECSFLLGIQDSRVRIEIVSLGNNQYQPIYYELI
ncbi:type II toxin-antitoxin system HigB family toxin [Planktothrix paucivesiculata]|uniref:Uncharacterized protein n=1 Tax=Planktothrix paucivesiculata PCC 9631 TaxID=671071 RepID=A0A7Z9BVB9_9CYAN|nr:type II toxin-antitoxin system HigB family toxin [Planktothrix paucivesiculata]VXD19169.1 conserved hypothetical protein [Planktothrix paucivesiculata PCC 9631]